MAKKNNNQVSAVRQAKHGWIWTLAFTVISILWIAPIPVVLLNSFKKKSLYFQTSVYTSNRAAFRWLG